MQLLTLAIGHKLDTIFNILGFGLSLYAFCQAKSAKEIAESVKKQFIMNHQQVNLGKIVGKLEVLISEVKVFGPSSSHLSVKGTDKLKIASSVQDFVLLLNEDCKLFASTEKKASQVAHDSLLKLLPKFSSSKISFDQTKELGCSILSVLSNLNSKFKVGLNKRIIN